MATMNQSEIAERALRAIGVLAAGQSPSAEDGARASEVVGTVYDLLRAKPGLPFSLTAVPQWAQQALINISGLELCAEFGASESRRAAVEDLAAKGRADINEQTASMRKYVPTPVDYY